MAGRSVLSQMRMQAMPDSRVHVCPMSRLWEICEYVSVRIMIMIISFYYSVQVTHDQETHSQIHLHVCPSHA